MKLITAIILTIITSAAAYAACTTKTYFVNGKVVVCTNCCDSNGNCTENCF